MSAPVLYGPIGSGVRSVAPSVEADPLGIYVAALSMWSAAISGTVKVSSQGSARPVVVWSALVGKSSRGKGKTKRAAEHIVDKALGRFLATHTTASLTSGAALVNHLWKQQEATKDREEGRDIRALLLEEEWSETLKAADKRYPTKLRVAWDGATLDNTTKNDPQVVKDPALVLHAHITPSDLEQYVLRNKTQAGGGSYNRILFFLLNTVPMMDDDDISLPPVDGDALFHAYRWATAERRTISLAPEAKPLWRKIRRYSRILNESLPEGEGGYIERTAEQTLRVAACLAASECSELITEVRLNAAFTLVRRSVQDVMRLVQAGAQGAVKRQPRSLMDKVRARIEMHGGKAASKELLGFVGGSAEEVRALPGVVVKVEKEGKSGRPKTMYRLADAPPSPAPAPKVAAPEEDSPVRPAAPAPRPRPRDATPAPKKPVAQPAVPAPAREENPFRAAL
ncbi:hypothetical protein AF335_04935 [Streptomyces eurocidicus]|uniref:DUF3987 domain-containing protein n=1 Tax=Streptomyces eurocidicus TaxID=66423 RepID=A0A2N8NZ42_STREU|nr:DUF3987 domain-containing protein [Streptomyces eurocidicus]MBB5123218.1 hypothetical protein [Streptomyces eurocidicus]MBF6056628.1 DUF3987 domain-containing protein [Streptomyces eurocidicus]PNE34029.1 hypothetical protein AF335_04935 [Streptomyces eurocidicus]